MLLDPTLLHQWLLQAPPHGIALVPDLGSLFQMGAVGAIVAFLLLKTEPRLKGIEAAQDRTNRTVLLAILAIEQLSTALKSEATKLLEETRDAERSRERDRE
jgi:hypothetical protein